MLGSKTAAAVRNAADSANYAARDLASRRDDLDDALVSIKTAGQMASIAFGLVAIVAVVALLMAAAAVANTPRKG